MKCPKCQADNSDTSRFCSNCATQLTRGGQPSPELTKTLESPVHALTKGSLVAGKYRIIDEIGRGGMGVVYDAEDTTLDRRVAVKILPEIFTADPERLARFEREAKILASLNHPNIATIYGLEEADGKRFLIMEMVEGETLAERISRGPLPLREALDVCFQVAEGVQAAHEKGIIHRDLKPANIKLTLEGKVKVLDFGLAKAFHEGRADSDLSKSPTITEKMTVPGVILGTAAYMSPEQAKGRPVDKRTDIWALGCMLFESLAGKRPFLGDTVTETIAAILRGEPDWDSLPADTPKNVRAVLRQCLQKDAKDRLHDIADVRLEIDALTTYPSEQTPAARRFSPLLIIASGAILLLSGTLLDRLLMKYSKHTPDLPAVKSIVRVEPGLWLDGWRRDSEAQRPARTAMAISNDGSFIVYSAIEENLGAQAKSRLYVRRMDESVAKSLAGTEGGIHPFLSPDDQWVGFWADSQMKKIPINGDRPATAICSARGIYGASWHDSYIVFANGSAAGLLKVSTDGGEPELLTNPDPKREETSHRLPSWLPNGQAVLFTIMRHGWDMQPWIALLQLDTREWRVLLQNGADARYVPSGHLVFLRQGTLMAVRFDLNKLKIVGQPYPVVENVVQALNGMNTGYNSGAGQFSVSPKGSLIYAAGGVLPPLENSLVWVDTKGSEQPAVAFTFPFFAPRLSPDGRRIAYGTSGKEWQIWVYDLDSGTNSRLTAEGRASYPVWTRDGKRIVFEWHKSLASNLFWQVVDGSSPMERLTTSAATENPASWSPNSEKLALVESGSDTGYDISVLETGSGRVSAFLHSNYAECYPEFSPDGRWIAYSSNESKRYEVYVRPFPGPGGKWQVSGSGGMQPVWSKNGERLFYKWEDQVWMVDFRTDSGFSITNRRILFARSGYSWGTPIRSYDISHDGLRFLMVKSEQRKAAPVTEMILVQNWLEELKRLVPTGKK